MGLIIANSQEVKCCCSSSLFWYDLTVQFYNVFLTMSIFNNQLTKILAHLTIRSYSVVQAAPAHFKQTYKTSSSPRSTASMPHNTLSLDSSGFGPKIVKSRSISFHSCALLPRPVTSPDISPWLVMGALNIEKGWTSLSWQIVLITVLATRGQTCQSPPSEKPPPRRWKSSRKTPWVLWSDWQETLPSIGEHLGFVRKVTKHPLSNVPLHSRN